VSECLYEWLPEVDNLKSRRGPRTVRGADVGGAAAGGKKALHGGLGV
jgi:hypothetical protein